MKKEPNKQTASLHLDEDYKIFLTSIKNRLKTAQVRAALAANSELVKFYLRGRTRKDGLGNGNGLVHDEAWGFVQTPINNYIFYFCKIIS